MAKENLLGKIMKVPIIGKLIRMELSLINVHKNCQRIADEINSKFEQMPRSSTCMYSRVPEGRIFCNYYKRLCISYCNSCGEFKNRYLTEK